MLDGRHEAKRQSTPASIADREQHEIDDLRAGRFKAAACSGSLIKVMVSSHELEDIFLHGFKISTGIHSVPCQLADQFNCLVRHDGDSSIRCVSLPFDDTELKQACWGF